MKLVNSKLNLLTVSLTAILALSLTACGGNDSKSDDTKPDDNSHGNDNGGDAPTSNFGDESVTWTVNGTKQGDTCYDFDSKAEVDCTGINWDIKYKKEGRSTTLWTNNGTSGDGNGGALQGLRSWSELKTYSNATIIDGNDLSRYYKADSTSGVFGENKWYEYNLKGGHQLFPNYKVYLVTTDSSNKSSNSSVQMPVYAVQVINYYNEAGTSGHQTLRWIDTSMPDKVQTVAFDTSSQTEWVYVDLKTGTTTTADGNWHVSLKRMDIKLNGGDSGTGNVAGFMAVQPAGFYDADGKAIADKFANAQADDMLSALTDTSAYSADEVKWVSDSLSSVLNPSSTGTYPNLDYGWYTYSGVTHQLSAKTEAEAQGAIIKSGEGNSYARMWLKEINATTGEWTYEMNVQPAS